MILTADGFADARQARRHGEPGRADRQVTVSFPNLPQSPLTDFDLHVFGSERGLLATPTECGTYAVHSTFTPWDAALAEQNATQFFTLDHGPGRGALPELQPRGFSPEASRRRRRQHRPARTAPFGVELDRPDGEQVLTGLDVTTPPGFTATLKGIPYCPESAIAQLSGIRLHGRGRAGIPELSCAELRLAATTAASAPASQPRTFRARSTWPVPTKVRRSASRSSSPRYPGPTTSATSPFASRSGSTL